MFRTNQTKIFCFIIAPLCLLILPVQSDASTKIKHKSKNNNSESTGLVPEKIIKDCHTCPEMVTVPAGSYKMGSNIGGDVVPAHIVTFSQSFAIGKTEITQGQWKAIMGNNPSHFAKSGDNFPVEKVNWNDAQEFIKKLNEKTGKHYRLPSEAEWEYACRAGEIKEFCGDDNIDKVAWYRNSDSPKWHSGAITHQVATKNPNSLGLYDMSGNVWEWVEDSYHANYIGAPSDGSAWSGDGKRRVLRGGSWDFTPLNLRSVYRSGEDPSIRESDVGFRVVRTLP
jgi:formylglycine-generating enzyme required for sulfatase activity